VVFNQISGPRLVIAENSAGIGERVAEALSALSIAAVEERGRFTIALSGGSMPKLLAAMINQSSIPWAQWHVFFVDERCVALDDDDSNYKHCKAHLFDKVGIPENQIYPINPALSPEEMAREYQGRLESFFGTEEVPVFDAILLGMGPDGHCASLFPGHPLVDLSDPSIWIASIADSPKPPPNRITFTLPIINSAREVLFLAGGASKAPLFSEIFETSQDGARITYSSTAEYPVVKVHAANHLTWYIDSAAAERINEAVISLSEH